MTEPQGYTTPGLQAKVELRRAWFEAHPNQPIPEGRAQVERLFAAIETTPAGVLPLDAERLRKAIDLSGIGIAEGGSLASDWAEAIAEEYDRLGGASQGSILPPITPIPGLDVQSANDLLSPEAKAGLDANLRDIARTQRQALSAAATMPLGSALPATPVGVLDEAALREALRAMWPHHTEGVGSVPPSPSDHSYEVWEPFLPGSPDSVAAALAAALGRSGSGGGRG